MTHVVAKAAAFTEARAALRAAAQGILNPRLPVTRMLQTHLAPRIQGHLTRALRAVAHRAAVVVVDVAAVATERMGFGCAWFLPLSSCRVSGVCHG
jgi:hypothetical protein